LLGALEELTALRRAIGDGPARVVRRQVLAHSLFGVDVKLTAVRLAELRLWLALVVDDDETDLARVAPLPNLDGHVRQGDALLDPLALARVLGGGGPATPALTGGAMQLERLGAARRALFSLTGPAKSRCGVRRACARARRAGGRRGAARTRETDLERLRRAAATAAGARDADRARRSSRRRGRRVRRGRVPDGARRRAGRPGRARPGRRGTGPQERGAPHPPTAASGGGSVGPPAPGHPRGAAAARPLPDCR